MIGRGRSNEVRIEGNDLQNGDIVGGDKIENHYHIPKRIHPLVLDEQLHPDLNLPNDSRLKNKLVNQAEFDEAFLNYARRRRLLAYKKTLEIESLQSGNSIVERLKQELENLYFDHCHIPILSGTIGRDVFPQLTAHLHEIIEAFPFEKFEGLDFDTNYLRGLIFETTAECRMRWARCEDEQS